MRSSLLFVAGTIALVAACAGMNPSADGGDPDGGSGDSGDGATCTPMPGCDSSTECRTTCGNGCVCEDGVWSCALTVCGDAG